MARREKRERRRGPGNKTRKAMRDQMDLQAERVIDKLGGPMNIIRTMRAMGEPRVWDPSTIYYWMYSKEDGGSGGVIPAYAVSILMRVARYEGVFLDAEDFYPGLK